MEESQYIIEFQGIQYGLLSTGFRIMPFDVCLEYQKQNYEQKQGHKRAALDDHLTFVGKEVLIEAEAMYKLQCREQHIYNQQDPDIAIEPGLDQQGRLIGMNWQLEQPSTVEQLKLTGDEDTEIQDGAFVGSENAVWLVHGPVTIGASGEVITTGQSQKTGAIKALAGEINEILTTVDGWTGVTNLTDAEPGRARELPSEYRVRKDATVEAGDGSDIDRIKAEVKDVEGVGVCKVFENDKEITNARGQQKRSIEVFAHGGDKTEIVQAMWRTKVGATPYVSTSPTPEIVTITDSEGEERDIPFSRPDLLLLYVTVDLEVDSDYPKTDDVGDIQVRDTVLGKGNLLDIGDDVVPFYLGSGISSLPLISTVRKVTIKIGLAADPTSEVALEVSGIQWAQFDSTRIVVNSTVV